MEQMKQVEILMLKLIARHYEHLVKSGRTDLIRTWGKYQEAVKAAEMGLSVHV